VAPLQISRIVLSHYWRLSADAILNTITALASVDALGNLSATTSAVLGGAHDFVVLPAQGLRRGPLAFSLGVGRGASSLVGGVVNALGTFVGSIAEAFERR
jgi:hypothetical protein